MKKGILLASGVVVMSLMSFTSSKKEVVKEDAPVKMQIWKVTCGDGSYGGAFQCDCSQTQANQIANIMCN